MWKMILHKMFWNTMNFLFKVYSTDNNRIRIIEFAGIKIKFKRHTFNWYKSSEDETNIQKYIEYQKSRKAKSVMYTCVINDYDDIEEIDALKYINKDWDYICFTDNNDHITKGHVGIWEIRPLQFTTLDNTRNNRWHKLHPHILFPEYEESIYIDSNINILTPYLFNIIKKKNSCFVLPKHYKNNCIYKEYYDILKLGLDDENLIKKERNLIINSGMPHNWGFPENNILYRRHNIDIIKKIDEEWWYMVQNYSKRDQLSLSYLLWKYGFDIKKITFKNSRLDCKNFFVISHKKDKKGNLL